MSDGYVDLPVAETANINQTQEKTSTVELEPVEVKNLSFSDFMLFNEMDLSFVRGINIIHGENSTGKTIVLKTIYALLNSISYNNDSFQLTKSKVAPDLVNRIRGVFRPDLGEIGRMVNNDSEKERTSVMINRGSDKALAVEWGRQAKENITIKEMPEKRLSGSVVYIPPKEIISDSEGYVSLFDGYRVNFERTYYDLVRLLEKPIKRELEPEMQKTLDHLKKLVRGDVVQKNNRFFLTDSDGRETEMGLLSEGYRKIASLMQLIKNGSIRKGSVLLWDEPESNMNPKMITFLVNALVTLAQSGVSVIIASHNYFVQQEIQLEAKYAENQVKTQFISLYKENGLVFSESREFAYQLDHNAIMDEFDSIYDREQELISGK